ncbi:hypothetical protein ACFLZX_03580 [Nanoarchaeota archaeon]
MVELFGLGQKKKPAAEQIIALRQQGMNDDQIIMNLQSQGYGPEEISDGLGGYDAAGGQPPPQGQAPEPMPPPPGQAFAPMPYPGGQEPLPEDRIEEIAEAIIDEKWTNLIKDINKIVEWKENVDKKLSVIDQEIKDVKERFEALHKGLLGKINEYDSNIKDVGVEIKAMEKVFQKVLPTFTENVNKMERILKPK